MLTLGGEQLLSFFSIVAKKKRGAFLSDSEKNNIYYPLFGVASSLRRAKSKALPCSVSSTTPAVYPGQKEKTQVSKTVNTTAKNG